MYAKISLGLSLAAATFLSSASGQSVVYRDTLESLPPFSICMDGATHRLVCANLRVRPPAGVNLGQFGSAAVEVSGRIVRVTCTTLIAQNARALGRDFGVRLTRAGGMDTVEYFASHPVGDRFLLLAAPGYLPLPLMLPGLDGPLHLDPANLTNLGAHTGSGSAVPYLAYTFPDLLIFQGIAVYHQALILDAAGNLITGNAHCFTF